MQKGSLRQYLLLLFYTGQGSIKKVFYTFIKDMIEGFVARISSFFDAIMKVIDRWTSKVDSYSSEITQTYSYKHNTAHSKMINSLKISYCIINSFFLWKIGETVTRLNLKSIYKDIMHYPSSIRRSSSSFVSSYPYYVTLFA